jgi:nucleotide-binding universal stress UspA family protein
MRKILLAINGIQPNRRVFSYAVKLCKQLKAELLVLQVVDTGGHGGGLGVIGRKARWAMKILEDSMSAAAFAEAGEHETAHDMMVQARKQINDLLPETASAGIQCHFAMKAGAPEREIVRYARRHRDIVLTVYDRAAPDSQEKGHIHEKRDVAELIRQQLEVPVVTKLA